MMGRLLQLSIQYDYWSSVHGIWSERLDIRKKARRLGIPDLRRYTWGLEDGIIADDVVSSFRIPCPTPNIVYLGVDNHFFDALLFSFLARTRRLYISIHGQCDGVIYLV